MKNVDYNVLQERIRLVSWHVCIAILAVAQVVRPAFIISFTRLSEPSGLGWNNAVVGVRIV